MNHNFKVKFKKGDRIIDLLFDQGIGTVISDQDDDGEYNIEFDKWGDTDITYRSDNEIKLINSELVKEKLGLK
jgi:hypothetical protein